MSNNVSLFRSLEYALTDIRNPDVGVVTRQTPLACPATHDIVGIENRLVERSTRVQHNLMEPWVPVCRKFLPSELRQPYDNLVCYPDAYLHFLQPNFFS